MEKTSEFQRLVHLWRRKQAIFKPFYLWLYKTKKDGKAGDRSERSGHLQPVTRLKFEAGNKQVDYRRVLALGLT